MPILTQGLTLWQHVQAKGRNRPFAGSWPLFAQALGSEGKSPVKKYPLKHYRPSVQDHSVTAVFGYPKESTASVKMLVGTICIKGDDMLVCHSSCWKLGSFHLSVYDIANKIISATYSSRVDTIRLIVLLNPGNLFFHLVWNGQLLWLLLEKTFSWLNSTPHHFYLWYLENTYSGRID